MSYMEFYLQKLSDADAKVRLRAAKLLESSRNPSALYRLKALFPREEHPEVRAAMLQAIDKLSESLNPSAKH
jgi:hypothetical protein